MDIEGTGDRQTSQSLGKFRTNQRRQAMVLTNNELTIRDALPADASQLCEWWNDGRVMAHAGFPDGLGETVEGVIEKLTNKNDPSHRHVIELNGELIGEMNYRGEGVAEVGIKICKADMQEKGYGTELLSAFLQALLQQGFSSVKLDTNAKNLSAQHVYEKIGFKKTGEVIKWNDQRGELQTAILYELGELKKPKTKWIELRLDEPSGLR
jgi:RimJ/RimL family protein N-acetyltransferase